MSWADLELVDELGNIPVTTINGLKYYEMNIALPAGRSGQAVLYSRWQRIDPAGEGFYNCSDIIIDGSTTEPPGSTWLAAGALLAPTSDANDGDTVWFRVFNSQGQEQIFEQLAITTSQPRRKQMGK